MQLKLEKKEAATVQQAIEFWQGQGMIDATKGKELQETIHVNSSSASVLGIYALIASVSCGLLAFGALIIDEKWIELLRKKMGISEWMVGIAFSALSLILVFYSKKNARKNKTHASSEAFNITIVLSIGVAMAYIGKSIAQESEQYSWLLLATSIAYFGFATVIKSKLLWLAGILTTIGWWAAQSYAWSKGADYFWGMNYALRMSIFALLITLISIILKRTKTLSFAYNINYTTGWLLLLIACWSLSILGNSSSIEIWMQIKQGTLWPWALGYTIFLVALLYYAVVKNNGFLRDTALLFLLLNIYTRYFEYFWDKTNKGLFFAILAISFWWLSRLADKWRTKQERLNNDSNQ